MRTAACLACVLVIAALAHGNAVPAWVAQMQQVHADFTGAAGTIARFGDSISCSWAYFYPLRWAHTNTTPESQAALDWIQSYSHPDIWTWQHDDGITYTKTGQTKRRGDWCGNRGQMTSRWPLATDQDIDRTNIEFWLATDRGNLPVMNPEIAVIMFGTNDVSGGVNVTEYQANMLFVTQTCKANGTIPILVTPPPKHGANMQPYAQAIHNIAAAEGVPVAEYYEQCVTRRPHDPPNDTWDGADPMWSAYGGYEVPTLISRDGVHPSNPRDPDHQGVNYRSNFSEEALSINGFNLFNYLVLMKCHEVYENVIVPEPAGACLLALGAAALLRRRRPGRK